MAETNVKRILVVEDDYAIRTWIADALDFEGYVVDTAGDGAMALDHVRRSCPDAIILDLMMPVMDGWGFIAAFRRDRICEGVPVLVTSAYSQLAQSAPALQVQACLAKPYDLDVLLGALERLLRGAAARRRTTAVPST